MQLFFIKCDYPILFGYWILAYALIFLVMFGNFYIQAYINKSKTAANGHNKVRGDNNAANGHAKSS